MAEHTAVTAEQRSSIGTRACRKLRAGGQVPANLYGHKEDVIAIQISADEVNKMLRAGHKVVDLSLGGKTETVIVRDMQWNVYATDVLHIDFVRVSKGELIHVEIEVELHGDAPGVLAGGVLEQPHHTIEIEVPALQTPDNIRLDIGELKIGETVTVADLTLPENVKCLLPGDTPIVTIAAPKGAAADEEATGGPSEPEVIGEKKDDE